MPIFSSNYLLPAILLNPAFVLHLINTFVSHIFPPTTTVTHSPHPIMESLGPLPGSTLYFDVHADDRLCWGYTGVMVVLQMLAIGRVQDNRDRRREAKAAARLERERGKKEKLDKLAIERKALGLDGAKDSDPAGISGDGQEHPLTGLTHRGEDELVEESDLEERKSGLESDTSVTETSEEEMFV
ncbi:uncharacterized protein PAC_13400 [Phialocephala subalpina]|uniref:Uncharacterized protein n=1 Tax=Phialocephala subalpina TaxID=576137 RepID=A0A1L7XEQ2_9HELO|nr:uncharacterized protein PAC_13400 [Phialocephala subalpina]